MTGVFSPMFSTSKKLSQTRLSSYFSGCAKMTPPIEKSLVKKKRTSGSRRRLSMSSTVSSEVINTTQRSTSLDNSLSLIEGIPKRKLPAPIFSDDEDSENERPKWKSPKRVLGNDTETKVTSTPTKPSTSSNSSPTTPKVTKSPSKAKIKSSPNTSSSKIRVLQDIVIGSSKESPQKQPLKEETKKVNYEQIKVMQEFFRNVRENDHLHSLLTDSETECLTKFFAIDQNYQYVCVKLFLYQPMWYNIFTFTERINLPMDNSQVTAMYHYIKENNLVKTDYTGEDLHILLNNLVLKDLRDIARGFRLPLTGTKDTIISKLLKYCKVQVTLTPMDSEAVLRQRVKEKLGFCVKLCDELAKALYHVYVLNTFTNSSLTDPQDYFTNVSFFNMVFPPYDIEVYNIFATPEDFARFAEVVKLRSGLHKALKKKSLSDIFQICTCAFNMLKQLNEEFGDKFDDSRPAHLEYYTPNSQCVRILTSGSRHITTSYFQDIATWYKYLLAQGYCRYKRGEWYAQLIHIYSMYMKNYEAGAKLLIKALNEEKDKFSDIQLQELAQRGKILGRKTYKLPVLFRDEIASLSPPSCDRDWPQDVLDYASMKCEDPGRRRMYPHPSENGDVTYLTVEQTALKHYRTAGFPQGVHCEGGLMVAAFCLLFWDIIYESKVDATFVSSVQNAPLDMYTDYFYKNREHRIIKRLSNIKEKWSEDVFRKVITNYWVLHSHESALCLMEAVIEGPDQLIDVLTCIGRPILAKIFERLVKNFKLYHSGFPDLIVWNVEEKKAKFVEVKSENDKLSLKQKLWLNYLIDIDAAVAVCHVQPKSSKKKLKANTSSSS